MLGCEQQQSICSITSQTKPALHKNHRDIWLIRKMVPEPIIRSITALYKCTLITAHSLARVSFENVCIFLINGHDSFFKIDTAFSVWGEKTKFKNQL